MTDSDFQAALRAQQVGIILPQPSNNTQPQLGGGFQSQFQLLRRDVARRVITRRISFPRECLHPLNQPGIGLEGQLQRLDCFHVMSGLGRGAIAGGPQGNVSSASRGVICRLEPPILGNSRDVCVLKVPIHNRQQTLDLLAACWLGF